MWGDHGGDKRFDVHSRPGDGGNALQTCLTTAKTSEEEADPEEQPHVPHLYQSHSLLRQ